MRRTLRQRDRWDCIGYMIRLGHGIYYKKETPYHPVNHASGSFIELGQARKMLKRLKVRFPDAKLV